jgi:hypothetical protein
MKVTNLVNLNIRYSGKQCCKQYEKVIGVRVTTQYNITTVNILISATWVKQGQQKI